MISDACPQEHKAMHELSELKTNCVQNPHKNMSRRFQGRIAWLCHKNKQWHLTAGHRARVRPRAETGETFLFSAMSSG
jgi:hypothetical protein